ncbi:hypothetical protein ACHAPO_008980 [Fusarium lateritium]
MLSRFDTPSVWPLRLLPCSTPELDADPAALWSRVLVVSGHDQHGLYDSKASAAVITCLSNRSNHSSYETVDLCEGIPLLYRTEVHCLRTQLGISIATDRSLDRIRMQAIGVVTGTDSLWLDDSRHRVRELRQVSYVQQDRDRLTLVLLGWAMMSLTCVLQEEEVAAVFSVTEASFISHLYHKVHAERVTPWKKPCLERTLDLIIVENLICADRLTFVENLEEIEKAWAKA